MTLPALTFKLQGLYIAYAPDSGVCSFGACLEEALNDLSDQLRRVSTTETGYERKENVIG